MTSINKIAVSGDLGSGKSTVCGLLEREYGYQATSTGAIQREMALSMNMTTYEMNVYSETHPEVDETLDGLLRSLSSRTDNIVLDSRMGFHFVQGAFKVYLTVANSIAAARVFADSRGETENYSSEGEAALYLAERRKREQARYLSKYAVDIADLGNYDLIVDTGAFSPDEVAGIILAAKADAENGKANARCIIATMRLVPTVPLQEGELQGGEASVGYADGVFYMLGGHGTLNSALEAGQKAIECHYAGLSGHPLPDLQQAALAALESWQERFPGFCTVI